MFSKVLTSSVVAICILAAPSAFADQRDADWQDQDVRLGPNYDYAKVISVDPIVRQVRVQTPRRECWTETYSDNRYDNRYGDRYDQRYGDGYGNRSYGPGERPGTTGRMILGGIIGAAIGNTIGHGDGRRAATVAGAVIGSAVGHDAGAPRDDRYTTRRYEPREVERCDVRYDSSYEERIEGYNVVYEYDGKRHTTRLPYDPGERIKVRVDVTPAED